MHTDTLDGPCIHAHPAPWRGASPILGKGGASVPKQNKKLEQMQLKLMQAQLRQAGQKIEMPSIPDIKPAPPPPPPPTQSSADVQESATEAQRQALKRSGYQNTTYAGDTGGFKSTLLGGEATSLGGRKGTLLSS